MMWKELWFIVHGYNEETCTARHITCCLPCFLVLHETNKWMCNATVQGVSSEKVLLLVFCPQSNKLTSCQISNTILTVPALIFSHNSFKQMHKIFLTNEIFQFWFSDSDRCSPNWTEGTLVSGQGEVRIDTSYVLSWHAVRIRCRPCVD